MGSEYSGGGRRFSTEICFCLNLLFSSQSCFRLEIFVLSQRLDVVLHSFGLGIVMASAYGTSLTIPEDALCAHRSSLFVNQWSGYK